jgi:hypothetical protein
MISVPNSHNCISQWAICDFYEHTYTLLALWNLIVLHARLESLYKWWSPRHTLSIHSTLSFVGSKIKTSKSKEYKVCRAIFKILLFLCWFASSKIQDDSRHSLVSWSEHCSCDAVTYSSIWLDFRLDDSAQCLSTLFKEFLQFKLHRYILLHFLAELKFLLLIFTSAASYLRGKHDTY